MTTANPYSLRTVLFSMFLVACQASHSPEGPSPDGVLGYGTESPGAHGPGGGSGGDTTTSDTPPPAFATDRCDDDTHVGDTWLVSESTHFRFHYFAGTPAERDLARIAADREDAYARIRATLGVSAEPVIDAYLSPSRVAARANGRALGMAFPAVGRYEVVYSGASDSYESTRYGHELTHVLAHHLGPDGMTHLAVLSEGVAEYLDQSGRDLHAAYAQYIRVYAPSTRSPSRFEDEDARGDNYARAGSLAQALVERYGIGALVEILRVSAVAWDGADGCYRHPAYGCVTTAADVESVIDDALTRVTGDSLRTFARAWDQVVEDALATEAPALDASDYTTVKDLLRTIDLATQASDPEAYRSVMDGFYCVWADEAARMEIAERMVTDLGPARTDLVSLDPTGTKNFSTARATVTRTPEGAGRRRTMELELEHVQVGWRITWMSFWQ